MLIRREARVGLVVFAAILVLIAVYWFLGGLSLRTSSYPIHALFDNAQKLDQGADIRMAGVKIGVVSDITLSKHSQARVDMLIWRNIKIPRDSHVRITTGTFIGDFYVEIIPGSANVDIKAGQRIASEKGVQMEELIAKVDTLITEFQTTTKGINKIFGDEQVIASIKQSVLTLSSAVKSSNELIQSAQRTLDTISPNMATAFANLATTSEHAVVISKQLEEAVADARPDIKEMLTRANSAVTNLDKTMTEAHQLLSSVGGSAESINQTFEKLNGTAGQAEEMMTNLNAASAGIKDVTTDKQLIADIKKAINNTTVATEQAKELITTLNRRYGAGRKSSVTPEQKAAIPEYGLSANGLWNTAQGNYRFDANYTFTFPGSGDTFYRIGGYNIGESTKLNLQAGEVLSPNDAVRFGLYASRLGIGYDHRFIRKLRFSADLFRPNEPEMEVRGIYGLTNNFGLYGGIQDLFHEDNRDLLVGVQYSK